MKEIIIQRKKIWIIFNDKELLSKPICKIQTTDNNEEYYLGIHLLKIHKYAINEEDLIDSPKDLPNFNLSQFISRYATK